MSRGYRVRLPARPVVTASHEAKASDTIEMEVDLLPILSPGEMSDLLKGVLEAQGWARDGEKMVKRSKGVVITLEADGRTLTLEGDRARQVTGSGSSKQEARGAAKAQAHAIEAGMVRDLAGALLQAEGDLRGELEAALQKVYVEALKRKAASLGDIESVDERVDAQGQSELTIKIRV